MCEKCSKERRVVIDLVTFGTEAGEVSCCFVSRVCTLWKHFQVVREIRFKVEQATGLTCSAGRRFYVHCPIAQNISKVNIGIAANWRLSKICSNLNKPNGQYLLPSDRDAIVNFMRELPIRKVNGVGAVTEALLQSLEVNTCGDMYEKRGLIKLLFSELSTEWFLSVALGITSNNNSDADEGEILFTGIHYRLLICIDSTIDHDRKSISVERTFKPSKEIPFLLQIIQELCEELIESLPSYRVAGGKSVTLKVIPF